MKSFLYLSVTVLVAGLWPAGAAEAQCDRGGGGCDSGVYGGCDGGGCDVGGCDVGVSGCDVGWGCGDCKRQGRKCCGRHANKGCRHAAKKACKGCRHGRWRGGCEAGCSGACECDQGCADGGCDASYYGGESVGGETVIDGGYSEGEVVPSEGQPVETQDVPPVPPEINDPSARAPRGPLFRATSFQQSGDAQLADAIEYFQGGRYDEVLGSLTEATDANAHDAFGFYFLALTHRRLGHSDVAQVILSNAIDAERQVPVANWGVRMQLVQGFERIWIEDARTAAGL